MTRRISRLRAPLAVLAAVAALLAGASACRNDDVIHKQVTPIDRPKTQVSPYRSVTPGPAVPVSPAR